MTKHQWLAQLSILTITHAAVALLVLYVHATDPANTSSVYRSYGRVRVTPSIAAILAILVGALIWAYGYKLLRPVIFICGFIVGGLLVALIIEYAFTSMAWVATASWIGFLVAGVISGFFVWSLYGLGVFMIGALGGIFLAFLVNTSFAHRFYPSQPDVMLIILIIVLGLLGGALTWKLERPLIIIMTAFIGAFSFVWGIGYFAGEYPSAADLKRFRTQDDQGDWVYHIPTAWWTYLAVTLLLWVLGVYVQFRKTGKHVQHTSVHRRPNSSLSSSAVRRTRSQPWYQSMRTPVQGEQPVAHQT